MEVLQTSALPLGYVAMMPILAYSHTTVKMVDSGSRSCYHKSSSHMDSAVVGPAGAKLLRTPMATLPLGTSTKLLVVRILILGPHIGIDVGICVP